MKTRIIAGIENNRHCEPPKAAKQSPSIKVAAIITLFAFLLTQCGIGMAQPIYNKESQPQNLRADVVEGEGSATGAIQADLGKPARAIGAAAVGTGARTDGVPTDEEQTTMGAARVTGANAVSDIPSSRQLSTTAREGAGEAAQAIGRVNYQSLRAGFVIVRYNEDRLIQIRDLVTTSKFAEWDEFAGVQVLMGLVNRPDIAGEILAILPEAEKEKLEAMITVFPDSRITGPECEVIRIAWRRHIFGGTVESDIAEVTKLLRTSPEDDSVVASAGDVVQVAAAVEAKMTGAEAKKILLRFSEPNDIRLPDAQSAKTISELVSRFEDYGARPSGPIGAQHEIGVRDAWILLECGLNAREYNLALYELKEKGWPSDTDISDLSGETIIRWLIAVGILTPSRYSELQKRKIKEEMPQFKDTVPASFSVALSAASRATGIADAKGGDTPAAHDSTSMTGEEAFRQATVLMALNPGKHVLREPAVFSSDKRYTVRLEPDGSVVIEEARSNMSGTPSEVAAAVGTVLVVDDEHYNRELFKEILESAGWTVEAVSDAISAVKELESRSYDLVLTDWTGIGEAVVNKVNTIPEPQRPAVIIATATPGRVTFTDIPVLNKPFGVLELLSAVKKILPQAAAPKGEVAETPAAEARDAAVKQAVETAKETEQEPAEMRVLLIGDARDIDGLITIRAAEAEPNPVDIHIDQLEEPTVEQMKKYDLIIKKDGAVYQRIEIIEGAATIAATYQSLYEADEAIRKEMQSWA